MIYIQRFIQFLSDKQWREGIEITEWNMQKAKYITPGVYERLTEQPELTSVNPLNSQHGITYFLSKQVEIPSHWQGAEAALVFEAGGEGLLKVNGEPYHGLDRNHWFVPLPAARVGTAPQLDIELYDPIPEPVDPLNKQAVIQPVISGITSRLVWVNEPVQNLLHSVKVAYEACRYLPEEDLRRLRIHKQLTQVMDELYGAADAVLADGQRISAIESKLLDKVRQEKPDEGLNGVMHMVGQSHIDIAWLWPVRETVRKVSRTFSTVTTLMEKYPDFKYSQSQPILYAFVKEHYPELYSKIKSLIAEGRWELVGGMWVEPDLNIPNGESLVRQMLHGQLFYEQEFGKRSDIEWLPDTFGYCASLPQLLKQAGVRYFMTTKLGWNDTNKFPYDLFYWVGIDGTELLSYQNHGVNEHTLPKDIHEHWQSFGHKDQQDELMLLYGHGDGGGGVTHEMVEYVRRGDLMPGQPKVRFATAADFFQSIEQKQPQLPKWHGDLYLELHRGTYTTHAKNKRYNRYAERLYRDAELWGTMASLDVASALPAQNLEEGWKLILLNQFHDIIPGTAIPEAYETSTAEYGRIFEIGEGSLKNSLAAITAQVDVSSRDGGAYVIYNSLGWSRNETIEIQGGEELRHAAVYDAQGPLMFDVSQGTGAGVTLTIQVKEIPGFGYKTIWVQPAAVSGSDPAIEAAAIHEDLGEGIDTPFYKLIFNELGEITSWYDKLSNRELISAGCVANELQLFHDRPTYWDAWDIDPRYETKRADQVTLIQKKVLLRGRVKQVLSFTWKLGQSVITQEMTFYEDRRRVDFKTHVDWKEDHKLLKVAFPVDLVASKASYEIPFGALERPTHRNTSWEQAQFEVCGYRWADVSENGFGVSLLNDCKYGYDIKDGVMRLSLLRAPSWPDVAADRGEHEFTYALYPHEGSWSQAHTVREAAELNTPVHIVEALKEAAASTPARPAELSWLKLSSRHVILDTVKPAEKGEGTIVRLYESSGGRETVTLSWPYPGIRVTSVNLLEDELDQQALKVEDGSITLDCKPFEVKSIKIQ
ncbi:alpha-mannosidase [Paenibacillus sp. F411]|uniref:alpha-mannosidase n=1 Tax=Paenibacillus sp. F411 TaxID=2820239 RepID=UPI001AAEBAB1|nr:alpha-mannosidase [Paenibacillus sp. F411]MBO2944275.1 alpha-mannosidase [Paenibacillus sp. F411]